jgi:hypothetical protein
MAAFLVSSYYSALGEAFSTRLFNFWPGLKVTTRRAVMGISSPVFGLRPGRWFLSRKSKLPKPESFTCSPFSRARRISSKNSVGHAIGLAHQALDAAQALGKGKQRQIADHL